MHLILLIPITVLCTVAAINLAIRQGQLSNRAGSLVQQPVDDALIRQDRTIAYPVRDDIPVMLIPEGLLLATVAPFAHPGAATHV